MQRRQVRQGYEVYIERGVTMTARDGTVFVMDVYWPGHDGVAGLAADGRFPTTVERTPPGGHRPVRPVALVNG
jgi:hypothetical protein